jgi:N,N'-diacetylbacillosaminyl-diphospho-undecaprenol alpha-1,3-N-acetylgalactosaminyltransferase
VGKLSGMGVKTAVLDFERNSASFIRNANILFQLKKIIFAENPDVVHNFTHKPAIYGTLAARWTGVKKIFITITGLGTLFSYNDIKTKALRFLLLLQYKFALKFVTNVFFQNPDDMAYFIRKRLISAEKAVLTNGSGIDIGEFSMPTTDETTACRRMLGRELGFDLRKKIVVIFPARAIKEKGFYEFYEAARTVSTRSNDYIFIHLGLVDNNAKFGISEQQISSYAKACGVFYLGFKDNMKDYLIASDIVALPTSYREGVPRSLIEALALDKYIITTDAPGCRETLIDGWNGVFCMQGNVDDLALKIMSTDMERLQQGKGRSRNLCEQKFDVEKLIDITFDCYFGPSILNG